MTQDQVIEWTRRGIEAAETFSDKMNDLQNEIMGELPPRLRLAGKKVICDGTAVERALSTEGLLSLCRETLANRQEESS